MTPVDLVNATEKIVAAIQHARNQVQQHQVKVSNKSNYLTSFQQLTAAL